MERYEKVLVAWREVGDRREEAATLGRMSDALGGLGDLRQALARAEEALSLWRLLGDRRGEDIQGAAVGTDDRSFSVRAERSTGNGSTGRVYTIVYRATDQFGNASEATATVTVPTDSNGLP